MSNKEIIISIIIGIIIGTGIVILTHRYMRHYAVDEPRFINVVDEIDSLDDGWRQTRSLSTGTYQITITSDEYIDIEVLNYINLDDVKIFDRTITIHRDTKLIITNPFELFGDRAVVNTKIYKEFP